MLTLQKEGEGQLFPDDFPGAVRFLQIRDDQEGIVSSADSAGKFNGQSISNVAYLC